MFELNYELLLLIKLILQKQNLLSLFFIFTPNSIYDVFEGKDFCNFCLFALLESINLLLKLIFDLVEA